MGKLIKELSKFLPEEIARAVENLVNIAEDIGNVSGTITMYFYDGSWHYDVSVNIEHSEVNVTVDTQQETDDEITFEPDREHVEIFIELLTRSMKIKSITYLSEEKKELVSQEEVRIWG